MKIEAQFTVNLTAGFAVNQFEVSAGRYRVTISGPGFGGGGAVQISSSTALLSGVEVFPGSLGVTSVGIYTFDAPEGWLVVAGYANVLGDSADVIVTIQRVG